MASFNNADRIRDAAPKYEIRAIYNERIIRVYQAYCPQIADAALKAQTFVPPFGMGRMTWIKPSFNWMMYRCGFGAKPNQERVLAVDILREGFDWMLEHGALSSFNASLYDSREVWKADVAATDVRIQWDPEKDWRLQPMADIRAIQIGLRGPVVKAYVETWIQAIEDVTPLAYDLMRRQSEPEAPAGFPYEREQPYPIPAKAMAKIVPKSGPIPAATSRR